MMNINNQGKRGTMATDHHTSEVETNIKNQALVIERRAQIVEAAVKLFVKYGYHKTTTRALAKETGLSIG
ncbi:MAG: TetR/AcrR family transcriptional regulator, partial [Desulforhopalus sp.]